MNPKKILASIVAAAVTAASISVNAFPTLLPLKTINVEASISGYTTEQLAKFPLKDLISSLRYSEDVTMTVTESANTHSSNAAPAAAAEAKPATTEASQPTAEANPATAETSQPAAEANPATAEASQLTAEADPATAETTVLSTTEVTPSTAETTSETEETPTTITFHRGDPVQLPENAVKVWVYNKEYSILDNNATVDISDVMSYDNISLIVGSGKQLDPGNVAYNVTLNIDVKSYLSKYTVKYYTLDENGEKLYIDLKNQNYSSYPSSKGYSYYFNSYLGDALKANDEYYVEVSAKLFDSKTLEEVPAEYDFTYETYYESDDAPNLIRAYSAGWSLYKQVSVTCTYTENGEKKTLNEYVVTNLYGLCLYSSIWLYDSQNTDVVDTIYSSDSYTSDPENNILSFKNKVDLYSSYPADGKYRLELNLTYYPDQTRIDTGNVKKAVVGSYDSLEAAAAADDITAELFNRSTSGKHFTADFSKGVDLTLFIDGTAVPGLVNASAESVPDLTVHINITAESDYTGSDDTDTPPLVDETNAYFKLNKAVNENRREDYFILDNKTSAISDSYDYLDSYFKYHYQTALICDADSTFDMSKVMLGVSSPEDVNVYDSVSGKRVDLTKEAQDFTNGPKQYTVAASGNQGNYTVNVVKKVTGGAKLFVNGPAEREIYLDSYYGMYHDVLVANIGDEELTGLNITLTDAENIKLDSYWVIGGENNNKLAPFTNISNSRYKVDNMSNLAKIRLVPDGEGEVKGRLTITADGQEPVTIDLKGHAGNPKIITDPTLTDGVKFVPYYAVIATDNIHEWNRVTFSRIGALPKGLTLDSKTGEILGVPQETGTFTFGIYARYSSPRFANSYQEFTITVLDNTDANVYEATDTDYDLLTPIGTEQNEGKYDYGLESVLSDQLFVSKGTYGEFTALWINGEKMTPDDDYTSESGSTRITIKRQTLNNKLLADKGNTIAAEFRISGTNEVRRTAQNVYINVKNSGGSSGGYRGGSTVSSSTEPSIPGSAVKGWGAIKKQISEATSGTITVDMAGLSLLPSDVTAALKGKDVSLRLITTGGELTINGRSVSTAKNTGVEVKRSSSIPAAVSSELSGAVSRTAFSVDNKGSFGYTAVVKLELGASYAGLIANIYSTGSSAACIAAVKIDSNGCANVPLNEGGTLAVAIDHVSRLPGDANGDLTVNSLDAAVILKSVTGIVKLDKDSTKYCDINKDGIVNALDASAILKSSVK